MKLREMMSPNPLCLSPDQKVSEAAIIFMENKVDGAPVLDENGKLIGLFTKSHIYRVINGDMDMNIRVNELMSRNILTGHPDDEFDEVITPRVPRLPVVDETGVVGMICRGDIAKAFFNSYRNISLELDAIINSTHNMIVSVNEKGIIKVFNRSAEEVLGIRADKAIGKHISDVLPTSELMDVIKSGQVQPLQKVKLLGRYFISNRSPLKKDGKIIGAVAVLQDISEMDKMSKELRYVKELNEELDAIVESSFDGLFITDGEGNILRYNKAFEQITGIKAHEYKGRSVNDIKSDSILTNPVTFDVLAQKKTITVMQESRNGKITLTTGNPVINKHGEIIRVVCNVRDITELSLLKEKLERVQGLSQHYQSQIRTLKLRYDDSELVFTSSRMRNLVDMIIRLAVVDSTILITGESGTGKELIAEIIHNNSARKSRPFIKVNCGAIPENLLESELFGYEKGAFTGAKKEGKPGYIELATGGTLLLDEIGEVPQNIQVKLLRFLQSKEISRVGGGSYKKVDVRILAATNRDLLDMVKHNQFRHDLYYRLNVVPVHVPPLRDRKDDIPSLTAHFLQLFNRKYGMNKRVLPEVVDIFMEYNWPGNVRELENLVERLVVTTLDEVIHSDELPSNLVKPLLDYNPRVVVSGIMPLRDAIASVEKQLLQKVYAQCSTTRKMARELKVDASTIVRKAAKYNISRENKNT